MQLSLLGTSIKAICSILDTVCYVSEAGVNCFDISDGTQLGYAALANVTCGTANRYGVFLGTASSGVYFLPYEDISGDSSGSLQQALISPTIQSNTIVDLAGSRTRLLITSSIGIDYIADTNAISVFACTVANAGQCDICGETIAAIVAGQPYLYSVPSSNWALGSMSTTVESFTSVEAISLGKELFVAVAGEGIYCFGLDDLTRKLFTVPNQATLTEVKASPLANRQSGLLGYSTAVGSVVTSIDGIS